MKRLLSESRLSQILNGVANGITVQDPSGNLVFVNEAAARMMNCESPAEALKKGGREILKGFDFTDEAGRPVPAEKLPGRLALAGTPESLVVSYTSSRQQGTRWTIIRALPVFDEIGQVILSVNVLEDITKLKETERSLRDANERITNLLEKTLMA